VDTTATLGGKQDPNKQRRKMILVYKTSMHSESQLNSAPCGPKADPMTRQTWLIGTLRNLDQYPQTNSSSPCFTEDTEIEADPPSIRSKGRIRHQQQHKSNRLHQKQGVSSPMGTTPYTNGRSNTHIGGQTCSANHAPPVWHTRATKGAI
jgi:hypothetical protein